MPLPASGDLRVRDVTHSTLVLDWDAAPGPVRKYLITYKPDNGEAKEVSYFLLPLGLKIKHKLKQKKGDITLV